jgi:hypothetical protein
MPARSSHLPTHLERFALQKLRAGELPSVKLRPTTSRIIAKLVAKVGSSGVADRIAPAGEAAMRAKLPSGAGSSSG